MDEVTITEPPFFISSGSAYLTVRKVPVRLIVSVCVHSSGVKSLMGAQTPLMPALASTTSSWLHSLSIWAMAFSISSGTEMSAARAIAWPPSALMRSIVSVRSSAVRPSAAILAPALARRMADAWPMPDPAPVTNATLFFSSISHLTFLLRKLSSLRIRRAAS